MDETATVRAWNDHARELWGLRADEAVGQSFFDLDIGLQVDDLRPAVATALAGGSAVGVDDQSAVNRRGRRIACRISVSPLEHEAGDVRGAIVLMEEHDDQ